MSLKLQHLLFKWTWRTPPLVIRPKLGAFVFPLPLPFSHVWVFQKEEIQRFWSVATISFFSHRLIELEFPLYLFEDHQRKGKKTQSTSCQTKTKIATINPRPNDFQITFNATAKARAKTTNAAANNAKSIEIINHINQMMLLSLPNRIRAPSTSIDLKLTTVNWSERQGGSDRQPKSHRKKNTHTQTKIV